ncbi:DUF805 domain-containing protein [Flavobacterium rhizosphaerae]|uniref:DUF805 domain-containing protein n=1 Tax=Flavobacterium rhizosphaerae TaxID=3163298 RepID=A0ABW8YW63_9FLAO
MIQWYLKVVRDNYANFSGRARRSEYWYFVLCQIIIFIFLLIMTFVIAEFFYLYLLYALATFVPTLAVAVRRLHDVGKSGWFYLLSLVPIANIYILILYCTDGDNGPNEYGPDPKNAYNEFDEIGNDNTM